MGNASMYLFCGVKEGSGRVSGRVSEGFPAGFPWGFLGCLGGFTVSLVSWGFLLFFFIWKFIVVGAPQVMERVL